MEIFNKFIGSAEIEKNVILYNFSNGVSIKYPKALFKSSESLLENEEVKSLLMEEEFLAENFQFENPYQVLDRTLQLILLVHEDCNFRCTYCYEKFQKGAMNVETADSVVKYIKNELSKNREKYDKLQISWFGGEPLLNLKVIEYIGKQMIEITKKYNLEYVSDITTNGYLLSKTVFKRLIALKVSSFQITLDGPKELHDKQRILKNGHGTYDRIIKNLKEFEAIIPEDVYIILRTNVGKDNYEVMESYISQVVNQFGHNENILMSFHNIGHWGEKEVEVIEKDVRFELTEKVINSGGNAVSFIWSMVPENLCYASQENHYVIGSEGIVYKCTVALYDPKNILGRLSLDGEMQIDAEKEKRWTHSPLADTCSKCSILPICMNNRCPLRRMESSKNPFCIPSKSKVKEMLTMLEKQNLITYEIGV